MQRLALVLAPLLAPGLAGAVSAGPIERVVQLITELKADVEKEHKAEQASYDKFACWCEETLGRKARDISKAKSDISDLDTAIVKLSGQVATHTAQISQLQKDIAANTESQRDTTEQRTKENLAFQATKSESEQCIGALEAAIKVLNGAGAGKKGGFLETMQEAQLLSVVAGVRSVLRNPNAEDFMPSGSLDVVKRFVSQPEEFVRTRSGSMSAAQMANNPFGDYAPQSTQIQGILKSMYDSFVSDLEKSNAEEAEAQKSFLEIIATKKAELNTLQETLERQTLEKATKERTLTENKSLKDDTALQQKADETFFADTKGSCKAKAADWSERTRLITEELHGFAEAINILGSPDSKAIFESAESTLLQVSSRRADGPAIRAASHLQTLAKSHNSASLSRVVAALKAGGHFDTVIASVDQMITVLRAEEQSDIAHRDRCQNNLNKNANELEDIASSVTKTEQVISRLTDAISLSQTKIESLDADIAATKSDMETLLKLRNEQEAAATKALKDDADAVALLEKAIVAMSKFYHNNNIELDLAQKKTKGKEAPQYTVDPNKAPETTWKSAQYDGQGNKSGNLIAILEMIKEDFEMEIESSRKEAAQAQAQYRKESQGMRDVLSAQTASKLAAEQEKADLQAKKADAEQKKSQMGKDLEAQQALETTLGHDCEWIKEHFDDRRTKRKTEIDGLVEAKGYLAGVMSGTELAP